MLRALITSFLHFGKLAPEAEEAALYFSLPYSYDPLRKQNNELENYQNPKACLNFGKQRF